MEKIKLFGKLLSSVIFKGPKMLNFAGAYLDAWNSHNVDAVLKLTGNGSYRDPIAGEALSGDKLREHAAMLLKAIPDLQFELASSIAAGDGVVSARYVLTGTNTGDLPGDIGFEKVNATGKSIALNGSIVFEFNAAGAPIVTNYFDQQEFGDNLGFQTYTMPYEMDDYDFGAFFRLNRGNRAPPKAVGLTWIEMTDPTQFTEVAQVTRETLEDFASGPGFITGTIGATKVNADGFSSGFTLSAWETLEDMDRIVASDQHKKVVHKFMKEGLAYSTHSRVYELVRDKPVMVACKSCGKKNNAYKKTHVCSICKAELPPPPRYW